jgi:hypothetical protein
MGTMTMSVFESTSRGGSMGLRVRRRFWPETIFACISGVLAVLTALRPDWIEGLTGFSPDAGNGLVEWDIVLAFAAVAVVLMLSAWYEWRRAQPARA